MEKDGRLYCNYCNLLIGLQKHVEFKKPNTTEYIHFHNRDPDDCWRRWMEKQAERKAVV